MRKKIKFAYVNKPYIPNESLFSKSYRVTEEKIYLKDRDTDYDNMLNYVKLCPAWLTFYLHISFLPI